MTQQLILIPGLTNLIGNTTLSYTLTDTTPSIDLILVHHAGQRYAYVDRCPHFGLNLNWRPDQYYNINKHYLQCSTHGALFRIEDGLCIFGPCEGASLQNVPLIRRNNQYFVDIQLFLLTE
ncbi:MAG: Rieske (2Fe-2S) protein [Thiohalomonadales bacterium]